MSGDNSLFKGDREAIADVDTDGPLALAAARCCECYPDVYRRAGDQAEATGDLNAAYVYRFLGTITTFWPSFDTPQNPFGPMIQMDGKRSAIPSDLSTDDFEALRELSKVAEDAALRARLFDLLWELGKDYRHCREAASRYLEAAESLNTAKDWIYSMSSYLRALQLSGRMGRDKDLFKRVASSLENAARTTATDVERFRCCQFLELLVRFRCGDPNEFSEIASTRARQATAAGDAHTAREYHEVEADLLGLAKDTVGEKRARLAVAETYVNEARQRTQGPSASFMVAASFLSQGIEALRQAGEAKERIEALRRELNEWQERSVSEFRSFSFETDISDSLQRARDHVRDADIRQALFKLAFGYPLIDPQEIKEQVVNLADGSPLLHLMNSSTVDRKGRPIAKNEGLLTLSGEAREQAIEKRSFSHAASVVWPLRATAFIEPARLQIFADHHPTLRDLLFVVRHNPFIPPDHEGIFLRGLHAAFHGDFLVAAHLLTPQIENSMRHVLELHGVDVSNLMSDGTQPVKVLGAIFGLEQTKKIFGESLCFELRGCLIEKEGFDFRNRVAHGFVSEGECYSVPGCTIWWLTLRICLTPIVASLEQLQKSEESSE